MSDNRLPGARPHPLTGEEDRDPGRWRPLYYPVEISVGINAGNSGLGSIVLNAEPWVMTRIQGKIIGDTAVPSVSGLYQDGQWDLEFRDEMSNYQKGPAPADLMFGGPASGYIMELPFPLSFEGNRTITFRVINRVNRVLVPESQFFTIGIVLHGIADWGTAKPQPKQRIGGY